AVQGRSADRGHRVQSRRRFPVDDGAGAARPGRVGERGERVDAAAGPFGLGAGGVAFGGERRHRGPQFLGGAGQLPVVLLELACPRVDLVAAGDGLAAFGLRVADGGAQVLGGALGRLHLGALPLQEGLVLGQAAVQGDQFRAGALQGGEELGLAGGDAVAFAFRGEPGRVGGLGLVLGLLAFLPGGVAFGGEALGLGAGGGGLLLGGLRAGAGARGLPPRDLRLPLRRVAFPLRDRDVPGGLGAGLGDAPFDAGDAQLGHEGPREPVLGALAPPDALPGPGDLPGEPGGLHAAFAALARGALALPVVVLAVPDGAGAAHRLRHGPSAAGARPYRHRVAEACEPGAVFGVARRRRLGGRAGRGHRRRVGVPLRAVRGRPRRVRIAGVPRSGRRVRGRRPVGRRGVAVGGGVRDDGKVGLRRGGGRGVVVERGDLLVLHVPLYARTP